MSIPIVYGKTVLPEALPKGKHWITVTTLPILETVMARLKGLTVQIHQAPSMEESVVDQWVKTLPETEAVLGVGGGVCMDAAKYLAWKRGLPFTLAPSVISVDACLTESIAIRRDGKVCYVGEVYPEQVLVDYSLIQSAPQNVNRAGAGDILSIHTALWDWRMAAQEKGESYDEAIAQESAHLLERLGQAATEIAEVTEEGLKTLVELYVGEVELCRKVKKSRPEEGSEHFWAYNVEYETRRSYVHGELVALGVLLMSELQENRQVEIMDLIRRLKVKWRPADVGLSEEEIIHSLMTAREYVEREGLAYSVINQRPVSSSLARTLLDRLR